MGPPTAPSDQSFNPLERVAGWLLLGGTALAIAAGLFYAAGQAGNEALEQWRPTVLGFGLLVTLFGLLAFEEALWDRGERLFPRFGSAAFAIGSTCFIVDDAVAQGIGQFIYELERVYTVLACLTGALFGWSILRSRVVAVAVGWFAIGWAVLDGFLYLTRIFQAPLGPNLAMLAIGTALLVRYGRVAHGIPH